MHRFPSALTTTGVMVTYAAVLKKLYNQRPSYRHRHSFSMKLPIPIIIPAWQFHNHLIAHFSTLLIHGHDERSGPGLPRRRICWLVLHTLIILFPIWSAADVNAIRQRLEARDHDEKPDLREHHRKPEHVFIVGIQ
ncbi:hypothetical protein EYZ11_004977 [Aspergillus tanneri]|uniref:Uncharacterized protein n=1 Tax=Aspergillus tanneri TaxID=1220188 RepID=A0A4S3JJJ2_9EURO|nr:uncharacterized protein ATNIH1004_010744 [Aspergillus tanneri]KAA8641805.1 hypothetical protein ATNIH1004_010744 [Aspergillus tanneri]THC95552.1 hypothetical protein EYZ11_004977 [Aspergillus tanneri]